MAEAPASANRQPLDQFNQPIRGVSLWMDAWRRLKKNRMAIFGMALVIFYSLLSLLAAILPIHSFKHQVLDHQYLPPSLTKTAGELLYERQENTLMDAAKKEGRNELNEKEKEELSVLKQRIENETMVFDGKTVKVHQKRYFLGTDALGRDLLARIIYGGQVSISIGLVGTLTAVLIGLIVGAMAGYLGRSFDYIAMRIVDIMYGLPYMLLVIIFMAIFGRNVINLFLCLALVSWLTLARVVRGQIISLKNSEFVQAARVVGASTGRIVFRHLVPNTLGVVVVFTTLQIPSFILMESFLSYLGLGVQAPLASWGSLVRDGVDGMKSYPWLLFFPGLTMTVFLFSMNFLGDGLRDALDPQSKNRL
ncbi:MAG: ABC transporter permease [Desulfobacterales bacterium]|nr:ABC transporter permease [Desulfobacterales bacterium]